MTSRSIPDRIKNLWAVTFSAPTTPPIDRGPRRVTHRTDPDGSDEAVRIMERLGGEVWAGDIVEIETTDPGFWRSDSFTLSFQIASVCLAVTTDQRGDFTFPVLFLAPNQGADIVVIEGDMAASSRVYLGVRGPEALRSELARYREAYLRPTAPAEVSFDIQTDTLGTWTAHQVRGEGHLWVKHGASDLVPTSAASSDGVPYRDASFYYGPSLATSGWTLRTMEYGGFGHAFQMESLPITAVSFWRRDRPGNAAQ